MFFDFGQTDEYRGDRCETIDNFYGPDRKWAEVFKCERVTQCKSLSRRKRQSNFQIVIIQQTITNYMHEKNNQAMLIISLIISRPWNFGMVPWYRSLFSHFPPPCLTPQTVLLLILLIGWSQKLLASYSTQILPA